MMRNIINVICALHDKDLRWLFWVDKHLTTFELQIQLDLSGTKD
jgi:hypothetical protein